MNIISWISSHLNMLAWILMIIFCTFLLYRNFDTSVSLDYAAQESKYKVQTIHVLQNLLLQTGTRLNREEITKIVKNNFEQNHIVKNEGNKISVDEVIFVFDGNRLTDVQTLNQYE